MPLLNDLTRMQKEQYRHDMRNHSEILCLHKTERLKHYGLHFAKYVGRLARESAEPKSVERTIVDSLLIALSAANTLHQDLSKETCLSPCMTDQIDPLRVFANAAGRFADACEKIDHLEEFSQIARTANRDIICWIINAAFERQLDLISAVSTRRTELASRHFYIEEDLLPLPEPPAEFPYVFLEWRNPSV